MDQNNMNGNVPNMTPPNNEGMVTPPQGMPQAPSSVPPAEPQTVAVNNGTLGDMVKFNIPPAPEAVNNSQPEPVPVQQPVQPTLGSVINNPPIQEAIGSIPPVSQEMINAGVAPNNMMVQSNVQNVDTSTSLPAEEKPKKQMSTLLKVLIFVLLLAVGAGIGFVFYQKNNSGKDNSGDNSTDNGGSVLNNNVINNTEVELATLTKVLNIVGVASTTLAPNNDILTYYVSNANYQEYAKEIISYYCSQNRLFETLSTDICEGSNCDVVKKEDVLKIFKIYNLGGNITDYFVTDANSSTLTTIKGEYKFDENYLFPDRKDMVTPDFANGSDFGISHNLNVTKTDEKEISVVDTQVVKYYDNGELQNVNRTVTYVFRQDDTDEYYLYQVTSE